MHKLSPGQFLQYRTTCLCGANLYTTFSYSTAKIDNNIDVMPLGSYQVDEKEEIITFPFTIMKNNNRIDFQLIAFINSNKFIMRTNSEKDKNYVEDMLSLDIQKQLGIVMAKRCLGTGSCQYSYQLKSSNNIFYFDNYTVDTCISAEFYKIKNNDLEYRFYINYLDDVTVINYKEDYNIRSNEGRLELPTTKFSKYPLDPKFIINKVKTLLLFS